MIRFFFNANPVEKIAKTSAKEEVSAAEPLTLSDFPTELLTVNISQYLDTQSKSHLSRNSGKFNNLFKQELDMEKLIYSILRGNEIDALELIKTNPLFLNKKASGVDYSGRIYKNVTPLQAALLTQDVSLIKKIIRSFKSMPKGTLEMKEQFAKIFPAAIPRQGIYDFTSLVEIINNSTKKDVWMVINKPLDTTSPLGDALNKFRSAFSNLAMKELFFNPQHLMAAISNYHLKYSSWPVEKLALWWILVIGYIQRFLPACYAQALCCGVLNLTERKQELRRTLEICKALFFPLQKDQGLGFDFGAFSYCRSTGITFGDIKGKRVQAPEIYEFAKYCKNIWLEIQQIQQEITTAKEPEKDIQPTLKSRCAIS